MKTEKELYYNSELAKYVSIEADNFIKELEKQNKHLVKIIVEIFILIENGELIDNDKSHYLPLVMDEYRKYISEIKQKPIEEILKEV